jgi:hypothetical protein
LKEETTNAKITFGLQAHHIAYIEAEIQRWTDMDGGTANPKYIRCVWERIGRELNWCPLTLALYYFRHLEQQ